MPWSLLGALFIWWPPHRIQINRREVTQNILLIIIIILSSPVNSRKISIHNKISFIEISCLLYSDFLFRGFVLLSFSFSLLNLCSTKFAWITFLRWFLCFLRSHPSIHLSFLAESAVSSASVAGWIAVPVTPIPVHFTHHNHRGTHRGTDDDVLFHSDSLVVSPRASAFRSCSPSETSDEATTTTALDYKNHLLHHTTPRPWLSLDNLQRDESIGTKSRGSGEKLKQRRRLTNTL